MQVRLRQEFQDGENVRYDRDYKDFMNKLKNKEEQINKDNGLQVVLSPKAAMQVQEQKNRIERLRRETKSLEQYEIELRTRPDLATVASVGITARLVDVKTGRPIWIFDGSKRDMSITTAVDTILEELIQRLLSQTPGA